MIARDHHPRQPRQHLILVREHVVNGNNNPVPTRDSLINQNYSLVPAWNSLAKPIYSLVPVRNMTVNRNYSHVPARDSLVKSNYSHVKFKSDMARRCKNDVFADKTVILTRNGQKATFWPVVAVAEGMASAEYAAPTGLEDDWRI